uniref:FAD dependent oxidoreductase domain-containing protein n=1 Tax=Anopheles farauti TaxID=69004 RepID=A0A182QDV7_9DIPT
MSAKHPQLVILGAGINGLTCAVRLLEKFPTASIQLISECGSPHTTSDVAAGLWGPYALGGTSEEDCRPWATETHDYLLHLWRNGYADQCGICLLPVVEFYEEDTPIPWWHDIVFGFQKIDLTPELLQLLGQEHNGQHYTVAFSYLTFTCEPTKIMNHYRTILQRQRNVRFRAESLKDIGCLERLPIHPDAIIVNCLGLGSGSFFGDTDLLPVRGQVQKIKSGSVFLSYATSSCYIIPNTNTVVLGGTKQMSDNLTISPVDRYNIRANCQSIMRSLKTAPVVADCVGLRPVRSSGVRLEVENTTFSNGHGHTIVHNYGHGGAGITLAWGCAGAVVRHVQNTSENFDMRSKL